jgi:hypothetical protein
MDERRPSPIRPIPAGAALLLGAMAGVLLLSDRVPVLLGIARNRFDAPGWIPWTLDDRALHLAMWFALTLLAAVAVRGLVLRLLIGAAAAVGSLLLEYLQIRWTTTRTFEVADVVANTWGVYLGLLAGLALGAALDAWEARRRSAA